VIKLVANQLNASGKRFVLPPEKSQLACLALVHSGITQNANTLAHQVITLTQANHQLLIQLSHQSLIQLNHQLLIQLSQQ
jgi:hypothetical protein